MNLLFTLVAFTTISLSTVLGQQGEKGTSIIPYPRVGRSDSRFFMSEKRTGNTGLIPFPRIGRSDGMHEVKRQLIPFPRVGKRPFWHLPVVADTSYGPYLVDYEDFAFGPPASAPNAQNPNVMSMMESPVMDSTPSPFDDLDNEKRSGNTGSGTTPTGGMWFGPRMGRKKRSISESDAPSQAEESEKSEHPSSIESFDTRFLVKLLKNLKWAIVPIKERRNSYTPRLGRSSSEEFGVHHRSQPYSPRLGRSREIASAELDIDEESEMSRYSRNGSNGGHHGKATQAPPSAPSGENGGNSIQTASFAPRLGRGDHFSPRLGRSGEDHE